MPPPVPASPQFIGKKRTIYCTQQACRRKILAAILGIKGPFGMKGRRQLTRTYTRQCNLHVTETTYTRSTVAEVVDSRRGETV